MLFGIGPFGEDEGLATTVDSVPVAAMMPRHHPRAQEASAESGWLTEHLSVRPPETMGKTWVAYWTLQDLGAPAVDRLHLLPDGTSVDAMAKFVEAGVIGPWPLDLPAPAGSAVRTLTDQRHAPRQVLISHSAGPAAQQLAEIAERLASQRAL